MQVGVLALQGGFAAHVESLRALGHRAVEVRTAAHLDGCEGLVLPGGESSVMLRLLARNPSLRDALDAFVATGAPVLATCAGLILAAREVVGPAQPSFGWLDVRVRRNAYGPQLHSAEAVADDGETPLVLIRAPRIERVGPAVRVELTLGGEPVLVRQANVVGATFHPELTSPSMTISRLLGYQTHNKHHSFTDRAVDQGNEVPRAARARSPARLASANDRISSRPERG